MISFNIEFEQYQYHYQYEYEHCHSLIVIVIVIVIDMNNINWISWRWSSVCNRECLIEPAFIFSNIDNCYAQ